MSRWKYEPHKKTYRRQRRLAKAREALPSCVEDRILAAVEECAARFGVSRSWVVAQALADYMGVDLDAKDRFNTIAGKASVEPPIRAKLRKVAG